jgi:HlyD family secretion protein
MTESSDTHSGSGTLRRQRVLRLGVLVLVLGGVVLLAAWKFSSGSGHEGGLTASGEITYRVTRGDLLVDFTERGTINAARSVPIINKLEGTWTITYVIADGSLVHRGDLLVELDSSTLSQQVNQQEITVESADAALRQAEEQVVIQESQNRSDIQIAELAVELAQIDLEKYVQGDYKLATTKAEGEIFLAEEELARAENKYEWTQKLAAKGYINRNELLADKLAVDKAKVQHDQAKGSLDLLKKYTHQKDLRTYETNSQQAKDALDRARRKASAQMSQALASKKAAESTFALSKRRLEKLMAELEKTKIYAPQDGMVVYEVGSSWGRSRDRIVEQGAQVSENQVLMQLPDVSAMSVRVQVQETWVDQVRLGQLALVSLDALPQLNLRGRITKVAVLPDHVNRWLNPDLKVYPTEIALEDVDDVKLLKPGMSAKAQVVVAKLENVIFVPVQSVTVLNREQVCYVLEGGAFRPQVVKTGGFNESFIEVASGLSEGMLIQLSAPNPEGGGAVDALKDIDVEAEAPAIEVPGDSGEPRPRVLTDPSPQVRREPGERPGGRRRGSRGERPPAAEGPEAGRGGVEAGGGGGSADPAHPAVPARSEPEPSPSGAGRHEKPAAARAASAATP